MRSVLILSALVGFCFLQFSCSNEPKGQRLAERSCGSCHQFPKAELLDKKTWEKEVLPRMGAWLGMGDKKMLENDMLGESLYSGSIALDLIPNEPQLSENDWKLIQDYYLKNAPDSLQANIEPKSYLDLSEKFDFQLKNLETLSRPASNSLIHFDKKTKRFFISDNQGELTIFDHELNALDSMKFGSTVSSINPMLENSFEALLMGKIRPNNESIGSLIKGKEDNILIPNLFRPVYMQKADLNQDGVEDYLICNFGYHVGKLAWYEMNENGTFKEHILLPVAGAIKTKIEDINDDGLPDIIVLMTQGNEAVYYFENLGKNNFKMNQWLSLPPVYGSSDFIWEDINNDGFKDIAVACGDNGDFSLIRKPYHGVRFFINDGLNHFQEKLFIPLQGATGIKAGDFDMDGDLDLAVIANFANYTETPQRGFVLYDNLGDLKFQPYLSPRTDVGRWLVFEQGDFDSDGDIDLLLGSYLINLMADREVLIDWKKNQADLLLLRNKHIK